MLCTLGWKKRAVHVQSTPTIKVGEVASSMLASIMYVYGCMGALGKHAI